MPDLDQKYRPDTLDAVVGQPEAVAALRAFRGAVPRALLFSGGTGCGKTTLARILCRTMAVSRHDLQEKNCGVVESAIDLVRDINAQMSAYPMAGAKRVWILDELIRYMKGHQGVCFATHADIVRYAKENAA